MAQRTKYIGLGRSALKIKYKKAFYDWVNFNYKYDDPCGVYPVRPEEEYDTGNVYLIRELNDSPMVWEKWIRKNFLKIFRHELYIWENHSNRWPKNLTWKKFDKFFEYGFNLGVYDLDEGRPIYGLSPGSSELKLMDRQVKTLKKWMRMRGKI